jgi:ATP-dependent RNA helicase DDX19/DBP5
MADAGGKTVPEKKSWADVEEEEEAKAAEAEAATGSSSKTEPAVEAQAKQIEALSLAAPEEDGGAEGPPLLVDSDDSQIQAVRLCPHTRR